MRKRITRIFATVLTIFFIVLQSSCKKTEEHILYEKGIYPDTTVVLPDLNSEYDDYNITLYEISEIRPVIFSSNRSSSGGQFDLVQGAIAYSFDKTDGSFTLLAGVTSDPFFAQLVSAANTPNNDFGPYRLYNDLDGMEYMILSSVGENGDLDFYYTRNLPYFGTSIPAINGPFPVSLLNSGADEAYICFDTSQDSAYFSSNADGNYDIYLHPKPSEMPMDQWLEQDFASSEKVMAFNSSADDKCPYIYRKIMVFASDREGGFGGFDLYYSIFSNGTWGDPVNMGSSINTSSDEYRPVLSGNEDFTNMFLIFSSNRPGGLGGFDLYYSGISFIN